jgi:hypothetical protein
MGSLFSFLAELMTLFSTYPDAAATRIFLGCYHSQPPAVRHFKLSCPSPLPSPHLMGRGWPSGRVRDLKSFLGDTTMRLGASLIPKGVEDALTQPTLPLGFLGERGRYQTG